MNKFAPDSLSLPALLESLYGTADTAAIAASPRAVFDLVRRALVRVADLDAERQPSEEEDREWNANRQEGRRFAMLWLMSGFVQVLRRKSEVRAMGLDAQTERAVPEPDEVAFRSFFGLPPKGDLRSDSEWIFANLGSLVSQMADFADEFEVMYADWIEALEEDRFIPRCWRVGVDSAWGGLKKPVIPTFSPDAIFVRFPASKTSPVATAGSSSGVDAPAPASGQPSAELLVAQERLAQLDKEIQDLRVQLSHEKSDGVGAQYRDLVRTLRGRLQVLEAIPRPVAAEAPPEVLPDTWDALSGFAASRLGGRVVISRRAYRAVRASVFRDVRFAFDVLRMLADDYVPMRHGEEGARARFEASCKRLRVRVTNTGEAVDAHRTSEMYRVNHLGKRLPLDLHVAGNSSRDPRDGFRLYFHYLESSDEPGVVVVGHLPSHLDSTLS